MREIIILDNKDISNLVKNIPIKLEMNNGTKLEIVTEDYYKTVSKQLN